MNLRWVSKIFSVWTLLCVLVRCYPRSVAFETCRTRLSWHLPPTVAFVRFARALYSVSASCRAHAMVSFFWMYFFQAYPSLLAICTLRKMPIQFVQQFEASFSVATLGACGVFRQRVMLRERNGCPFVEQAVHAHVACLASGRRMVSVDISSALQF